MQIDASVNYHVKKLLPQAFEFDVDGILGNLVSPELVATDIKVTNLRKSDCQPTFNRDGIEFIYNPSRVKRFECDDGWQTIYDQELSDLLKAKIGAQEVIVFDHTVRVDDPTAPRRPARNVHSDYNRAGAEQRLIDLVGEERAQTFKKSGYGFVNVWRPVENIIRSSPLGFIRPVSMNSEDWIDIELIYPDRHGQILGVTVNPHHEWFYQSEMNPDEVIIFNIFDNRGGPSLAHSALDLPNDHHVTVPRKSIESRTLVRYSEVMKGI
ncbi:CmcJ/NvfI family oxidoreductase [Hirschia litorea]|uniref:CmcJ/NvfI family oxidoreductase n=1 Tax=Hirschia litorea TaxID=1199156 RepID=A0ABW2IPB8_9PROT